MELSALFRLLAEGVEAPSDQVASRRTFRRFIDDYNAGSVLGADDGLAWLKEGEAAYLQAKQAAADSDRAEAIRLFRVAAGHDIGDAALELARLLEEDGDREEASHWSKVAARVGLVVEDDEEDTALDALFASGAPLVAADEGLVRRLKALACTAPLHELDNRKGLLDWCDAGVYQMAEIALHTIDHVVIAMDLDTGARHAEIIERVVPFVAAQAPERTADEHSAVARWVLENLVNVGTVDRGFNRVYGSVGPNGRYRRKVFNFKLLVELSGADGQVYLRATREAINVLVGALDTDIESAQFAAEVTLDNLITRGRLDDARATAERARYLTVQYGEDLRHKLETTRRDVRMVDWARQMPDLLDKALGHVAERFRVEHAILRNITTVRDDSDDEEHKRRAAGLVEIVSDCIRRHSQLQAHLQTARRLFRDEQDRQLFSRVPRRAAVDVFAHLLVPLLRQSIAIAGLPLERFFTAASGTAVGPVASLASLVTMLLAPPVELVTTIGPVFEPTFEEAEAQDAFTDDLWRAADELLDLRDVTRLLSGLLEEASEMDPDLAHLVVLRALYAYGAPVAGAPYRGDDHVLLAVRAGTPIPENHPAGFAGDDLLLTSARVRRDQAEDTSDPARKHTA